MKTKEEIRMQFFTENDGAYWTNSQEEPDIDYVHWLEYKLINNNKMKETDFLTDQNLNPSEKIPTKDGLYIRLYDLLDRYEKQLRIGGVVSSANVPAVRVRNYNEETGETEDGTVMDATLNTYLVIPDYNLQMTVRWDKANCDVLR